MVEKTFTMIVNCRKILTIKNIIEYEKNLMKTLKSFNLKISLFEIEKN